MLKMIDCMGLGKDTGGSVSKPQKRIGNGGWGGAKVKKWMWQPFGGNNLWHWWHLELGYVWVWLPKLWLGSNKYIKSICRKPIFACGKQISGCLNGWLGMQLPICTRGPSLPAGAPDTGAETPKGRSSTMESDRQEGNRALRKWTCSELRPLPPPHRVLVLQSLSLYLTAENQK